MSAGNAPYVEELYQAYLRDPQGVSAQWRAYFDALPARPGREQPPGPILVALPARRAAPASSGEREGVASEKQGAVSRLMQAYSNRGHLIARIDPLGLMQRERPRVLDLSQLGLGEGDLDTEFYTGSRNEWIDKRATLREILARLEQIYCGSIGAEFAHVSNTDERLWLQDEFQLGRIQQRF
ncbi:MAG TPA: 2-oxoglutarate dehydrogenase E1 component, partial [Steroidobacteraceae bacterium]